MKDRLSRQSNQLEEVEGELRTYNFGIIPGTALDNRDPLAHD